MMTGLRAYCIIVATRIVNSMYCTFVYTMFCFGFIFHMMIS